MAGEPLCVVANSAIRFPWRSTHDSRSSLLIPAHRRYPDVDVDGTIRTRRSKWRWHYTAVQKQSDKIKIKIKRKLFTLRAPAEAGTNSAKTARIVTKLRQNAFRTICNFRFFDAENFFRKLFFDFFSEFLGRFFIIFGRFWRS